TYGSAIMATITRVDPTAIIHDTQELGRPDLVQVARNLWESGGFEAVVFISNMKATREVTRGLEENGIYAYGVIFDSNCPISPLIYGDLPIITFSDNLPTARVGGEDTTFKRVSDDFYEPFRYKRGTTEIEISFMLVPPIQVEVSCTVPTCPTLSPSRIRKSVFQTLDGSLKKNGVSKTFTVGPDSLERLHSDVEEACHFKMASDDFKHVVANSENAATAFGGSVIYLTAAYA
ncbi:hypothetical protein FOZ62_031387, partial [Perkinsus olseni]